jgi:predicted nucleic acid-binding protein
VTLFLDSSVLLAACGSGKGASREIFRRAPKQPWTLITIPYVLEEVARNLRNLPPQASADWVRLRRQLRIEDNVLSLDRPAVFVPAKDRPILFSALAWSDVLLTLDTRDFGELLDKEFYGLAVLRPGAFLERERAMDRLR